MLSLTPDLPLGDPAFALSEDQMATVVDLVCRGAHAARADVKAGMLEVPVTIIVRKAMRRIKSTLALTNLQIRGEHELENMATADAALLGRIDMTLQFLHQFGNEDAYVAIECKRVGAAMGTLNAKYVSHGVHRFRTGQYGAGHDRGFMLGYVLVPPIEKLIGSIGARIVQDYGAAAELVELAGHAHALAVLEGPLVQESGHSIRLRHIFVDMTPAAPMTIANIERPDS